MGWRGAHQILSSPKGQDPPLPVTLTEQLRDFWEEQEKAQAVRVKRGARSPGALGSVLPTGEGLIKEQHWHPGRCPVQALPTAQAATRSQSKSSCRGL